MGRFLLFVMVEYDVLSLFTTASLVNRSIILYIFYRILLRGLITTICYRLRREGKV